MHQLMVGMGGPVGMPSTGIHASEVVDAGLNPTKPVLRKLVNDTEEVWFRPPAPLAGLGEEGDLTRLCLKLDIGKIKNRRKITRNPFINIFYVLPCQCRSKESCFKYFKDINSNILSV